MGFEREDLIKLVSGTVAFSLFFVAVCVGIVVFIPEDKGSHEVIPLSSYYDLAEDQKISYENLFDEEYPELVIENKQKEDTGLVLYRQPQSRAAVEWYYSRVVNNNREISDAILQYADEYSIPLSLAFALAHTESKFKITAMHKNTNGSIDRGLFQLNNTSFPKLEESDFYDPKVSARYGLAHLRFCLNTAGNDIAALAMYNAGANKVRKNNTPQTTLNYISEIQVYRSELDSNFASEVLAMYNPDTQAKLVAKK